MIKEAIATGLTVDEAHKAAVDSLIETQGVSATDDIQFEIIDQPRKKVLGIFGGCPAKVRAFVELPEPKREKKAPKKDKQNKTEQKPQKAKAPEKKPAEEKVEEVVSEVKETKVTEITDPAEMAVAQSGMDFLKNVLNLMNVDATLSAGKTESGMEILIEGNDLGVVVGRRGETLDALQYLTVLAANRKESGYNRITLNTGNYREKRAATLNSLANRMANQALRSGRNVTLEPMNPYERRIIHTTIQNIKGVTSWSVGEEPMRRVVIGTERGKGGYNRQGGRKDNRRQGAPREQIAATPDREQKKDFDSAPLYGKIEKKN